MVLKYSINRIYLVIMIIHTFRSHDHFNASEIGQKLAGTILSKLDPTLHPLNTPPQDKYLIPIYSQPKVLYTRLPG